METRFIEGMHPDGRGNHGKFLVGRFTSEEWGRRSAVDNWPLLGGRGWSNDHIIVMDLQTGEGAVFKPGGLASADLKKHRVWVCPLFEPFLTWLYQQDLSDLSKLPALVEFPDAEFALSGYRRPGPDADHVEPETCKHCVTRNRRGFPGQCPMHARARARRETVAKRNREKAETDT